ncbi:MAG: phosphodiester glycosidase family protein, partial [Clostridia bacterium]|nr:phosphodiester glycosidase family protein [Clostridia bacterium]
SQSPINPATMATVSYMENELSMSYLDFHIMAVAPTSEYSEIRHLNKHTAYYGDILMYTSEFNGGFSPAPGGEVLEVVVQDGIVTEFRRNMPPVEIPENGCVLVVSEGVNMFFANNFKVGDEIRFDYYITPDIGKADAAFGGGAMLVTGGEVVKEFSHVISGYNPRSAIGVDESGTTLYLVAVDGRQTQSKGMTMQELAELMKSLGCHNAVNLDGGGSTNMVASTVWNEKLHKVNSPTENRKVINAVGLTYDGEKGEPKGIMLEADKNEVFIGHPVKITTAVHDENMRPLDAEINLSSEHGTFNGNVFTPNAEGVCVIEALCGDITEKIEIYSVSTVSGISVKDSIRLNEGETEKLEIEVFDNKGHFVKVSDTELFEIKSSNPSVISVSGGTLKAEKSGTVTVSVKKDSAVANISVAAGGKTEEITDSFETVSGTFKSYPKTVEGSFELTDEQSFEGEKSGKLTFDFTQETNESKAVYYSLAKKHRISYSSNEVSVAFYSEEDFSHELKAQFTDVNGELLTVSFGRNFEKGKWHELVAKIPEDAKRPLKIDSVYCLYTEGDPKDIGQIYIDNLKFTAVEPSEFSATDGSVYTESETVKNPELYIGMADTLSTNLLTKLMNIRMTDTVLKNNGKVVGVLGNAYSETEDENALYITLDTSKGGIRKSNSGQWTDLKKALTETDKENVFILSDNPIFGGAEFENKVLCDLLASVDKNVFVVTTGDANTYKNIGGVKYFTLGNANRKLDAKHLENYKYLVFEFGKTVKFEFKSI